MIVRIAKKNDVEKLIELGVEFAQVSQKVHGFNVSRDKIERFTNNIIENDQWISLVLEDENIEGILTGIINTPFFSDDVIAQEVFWYVRKNAKEGLKMMFEFERIAKEKNCKRVSFGHKPGFIDMKVIYERLGYHMMESQYIKDV